MAKASKIDNLKSGVQRVLASESGTGFRDWLNTMAGGTAAEASPVATEPAALNMSDFFEVAGSGVDGIDELTKTFEKNLAVSLKQKKTSSAQKLIRKFATDLGMDGKKLQKEQLNHIIKELKKTKFETLGRTAAKVSGAIEGALDDKVFAQSSKGKALLALVTRTQGVTSKGVARKLLTSLKPPPGLKPTSLLSKGAKFLGPLGIAMLGAELGDAAYSRLTKGHPDTRRLEAMEAAANEPRPKDTLTLEMMSHPDFGRMTAQDPVLGLGIQQVLAARQAPASSGVQGAYYQR